MSTYAVFGMTRPRAVAMARKSVDRLFDGLHVPESKWTKMVDKEANKIMKSSRSVMLSEKFDAPQFAEEFRSLARRIDSRHLTIKAYCKTGEKTRTGKSKMHWVSANMQ